MSNSFFSGFVLELFYSSRDETLSKWFLKCLVRQAKEKALILNSTELSTLTFTEKHTSYKET